VQRIAVHRLSVTPAGRRLQEHPRLAEGRDRRRSVMRALTAVLAVAVSSAAASAQAVVPTDGMVITANTVFVPGNYSLPHGVSIGASNVDLDLNGAVLTGSGGFTYG